MPISWNEIRHNAIRFSKEWTGVKRESAEKQTFWNEFFAAFGLRRRTVASFEEPVRKLTGDHSFIDLFWPGTLIVEHKSFGKDLSEAQSQAFRYIQDLARDPARHKDSPATSSAARPQKSEQSRMFRSNLCATFLPVV